MNKPCLVIEAIERFNNPLPIKGALMFWMGLVGLLANSYSVFLLHQDKAKNINIKAAYLHLLGDALTSLAVIAGAGAIYWLNWTWIDPLLTITISVYLISHTWNILSDTVKIIMQFAPTTIKLEEVKYVLEMMEEIDNVHHIHIWQLTDREIHLEAHIELMNDMLISEANSLREAVEEILIRQFGVTHTTLQVEYESGHDESILES